MKLKSCGATISLAPSDGSSVSYLVAPVDREMLPASNFQSYHVVCKASCEGVHDGKIARGVSANGVLLSTAAAGQSCCQTS